MTPRILSLGLALCGILSGAAQGHREVVLMLERAGAREGRWLSRHRISRNG
jgi:hypothetical protein